MGFAPSAFLLPYEPSLMSVLLISTLAARFPDPRLLRPYLGLARGHLPPVADFPEKDVAGEFIRRKPPIFGIGCGAEGVEILIVNRSPESGCLEKARS
jgi:hypothetical protein